MQHLHVTCLREQLFSLVEAFTTQLEAAEEHTSVLDYGYCQKSPNAFLVCEWQGEVDEAFITQLDAHTQIVDYCIYTVPYLIDDVPFSLFFSQEYEGKV